VCGYLAQQGISPRVIIEPTYGAGNFVLGALKAFPRAELLYGVEAQEKYQWNLKIALLHYALCGHQTSTDIELYQDNIFTHSFSGEVLNAEQVLIVGNPPWVTNAELSSLNSQNLPEKSNIKALQGMDAITGKSNFDIGEVVLLRLLKLFSTQRGVLAMLCKNSVIRNIIEILPEQPFSVSDVRALEIDAYREFGVAVDASLLILTMASSRPAFTCQVGTLNHPDYIARTLGWVENKFVSNVTGYNSVAELDGKSPIIWRQGLKHDCAKVMELSAENGGFINGYGDRVDIEDDRVYWLLKSSDLRGFETVQPRKKVIVTQDRLGDDTSVLKKKVPKLWAYLMQNREHFEQRKSKIYQDKPLFSIFGIGEYSFKLYKVAISGLYKEPQFSLGLPIDGRPVMLDDTCYFLGFDSYKDALFAVSLLNSPSVKQLLQAIVFQDAKRPYTKKALMRIDLSKVAFRVSFESLCDFWDEVAYVPRLSVTKSDFDMFKQRISSTDKKQESLQLSLGI
jgi:hypothetical protein